MCHKAAYVFSFIFELWFEIAKDSLPTLYAILSFVKTKTLYAKYIAERVDMKPFAVSKIEYLECKFCRRGTHSLSTMGPSYNDRDFVEDVNYRIQVGWLK